MAIEVNKSAVSRAKGLIKAGKINHGAWERPNDPDQNDCLGIDTSAKEGTEERKKYPVIKDGEIYVKAVGSAIAYAKKNNESEIASAAQELSDMIVEKGKKDGEKAAKLAETRKAVLDTIQYREFKIETRDIDKDKRTVSLALSSETPVDRFYGKEILDHGQGSIRMGRILNNAPFLDMHDPEKQIGVIVPESVKLGSDKVLRCSVRMSKNPHAEEIFQDMMDGIRSKVSVGYNLHALDLESAADEEGKTYRSKDWEPIEGSSVSLAADEAVGIGRSLNNNFNQPPAEAVGRDNKNNQEGVIVMVKENEELTADQRKQLADTIEAERKAEIESIGTAFGKRIKGGEERMKTLVQDAIALKQPAEAFRGFVFMQVNDTRPLEEDDTLDLSANDRKKYSLGRMIRAQISQRPQDAPFELECSQAIEKNSGRAAHGFLVPVEIFVDPNRRRDALISKYEINIRGELVEKSSGRRKRDMKILKREQTVGSASGGGNLVGTEYMPGMFIEVLRPLTVTGKVGVSMLSGLKQNVLIPRQTNYSALAFGTETADASENTVAFDDITLTPHEGRAFATRSRQTWLQALPEIDGLLQNDLIRQAVVGIDNAYINGSGANAQPKGLVNTTGVNSVSCNGIPFGRPNALAMEAAILNANADVENAKWLTSPTTRGTLKSRPQVPNFPTWIMDDDDEIIGKPSFYSTIISNSNLIYGDHSMGIIGFWGGAPDVLINPFYDSLRGKIAITVFIAMDCGFRHPVSFAIVPDFQ